MFIFKKDQQKKC